jgi:hypothetical protein
MRTTPLPTTPQPNRLMPMGLSVMRECPPLEVEARAAL